MARVYGGMSLARGRLHGERAIGAQPLAVVFVAGVQRLLDQQAAESGAVDEQVARHGFAVLEHQRLDEAGFRMLLDGLDLAFDSPDTLGLAELA